MSLRLSQTLVFAALFAVKAASLPAQVPSVLNYQGRVAVGGTNFDGTGQFKFALVDATGTTTYWSNDGSSTAGAQPTAAVSLTVTKGLYAVPLGDATLSNMSAVPPGTFANPDVRLRVWFNDGTHGFQLLTPDQRVTAVGYALTAAGVELPVTDATGKTGVIRQNGMSLLHTFGTNNTFTGTAAGNFTLTGLDNTATGAAALGANTTGERNAAFGTGALSLNTTGYRNTALGRLALSSNTTGFVNTAVGNGSLLSNVSGSANTAVGAGSLIYSSGSGNVAIGQTAGIMLTTGDSNIYLANQGVDGESLTTRIGADGVQTNAYIAGVIHGDGSGLTGLTGSNLASGLTLAGTTTGTFSGSLAGNATTATTAVSFTGPLAGDLAGTQAATVVASVGGVSATSVASGANLANAASNANTASTLVRRDASGNFSAGSLTLAGSLALPPTGGATVGVMTQNGNRILHTYGVSSFFAGEGAGNFTMTGPYNTGVGYAALQSNGTGFGNTALGLLALTSNTGGNYNVATGVSALLKNTSGSGNTATGFHALTLNTTGNSNTAIGDQTLQANTTGGFNVAVGEQALFSNVNGTFNVAVGSGALFSNTTGTGLTATGNTALHSNTTGANNTAAGYNAIGANTTGAFNTAAGFSALSANTTGSNNLALGYAAGSSLTTGDNNIAIGNNGVAGESNVIRIGNGQTDTYLAGVIHGDGSGLTGLAGSLALPATSSASVGVITQNGGSLLHTYGSDNFFAGQNAGNFAMTGYFNTGSGERVLNSNTTGNTNTGLGFNALANNTTGTSNLALGSGAGQDLTTGDNNIMIGNSGVAAEANTIRIGTFQSRVFLVGVSGVTSSGGAAVFINSSGQLGTITSSRRFKDDIRDMDQSSTALLALRPVSFRYKPEIDAAGLPQFGLIAEEVAEVNPDLVIRDASGAIQTVRYEQVNAMLLNEFLKDHRRLAEKDAQISALQERLAEREAQDEAREARLARLEQALLPPRSPQQVALQTAGNPAK